MPGPLLVAAMQFLAAAAEPATLAAPEPPPPLLSSAAADFVADATQRLIAGEELPRDFPLRLQVLPPEQRLLVIVHLRRAGYLADVVMPVDWVISPASPPAAPEAGR